MLSGKHPWDDGKQLPQHVSCIHSRCVFTMHMGAYAVNRDIRTYIQYMWMHDTYVYTVHVDA